MTFSASTLNGGIGSGFGLRYWARSQKQLRQIACRPLDESNAIRPED